MDSSHPADEALHARIRELEADVAALRSANSELQKFAYAVSHDLKAPLRTIASFAALLAKRYKGKLDAEADEFIGYILAGTSRMEKLILDLLVYSRLLQDAPARRENVNMEAAVNWVKMNLDGSIKKNSARIECGPLPVILGDQQQIVQLLQHLLKNAIQYGSEAPPEIRVTAEERDGEWLFAVADNGTGFETAYSEKIFEVFKRLHAQDGDSNGMGLALSRKIVERHGGRIWAESTLGKGSTFYFTLPA